VSENKPWDLIVIGGGAAGLAAAVSAAEFGDRVLILEAQDRVGKKILASGNGRCNLMNSGELKYYGDSLFASRVFEILTRDQIRNFWFRHGLSLSNENERVYPGTFQAQSVLLSLKTALYLHSVDVRCSSSVHQIEKISNKFRVYHDSGIDDALRVLVASGGAAQPRLGGSGDGYEWLRKFGHTIHPLSPSLVPLITDQKAVSGLSGIRVRCRVRLLVDGTEKHFEKGELLFTDNGVSGICAMQLGRFFSQGAVLEIHFLHRWFERPDDVIQELRRRQKIFSCMSPEYLLNGYLLPKVSFAVCKQAGLAMRGEKITDLSDEMLLAVAEAACKYKIPVLGTKGFNEAQVTAGGADPEEFFPDTFESRLCHGLFAAGEILDVDGDCGGFNLMFAFAGGILAGCNGRR
jgi:hypothetical protein